MGPIETKMSVFTTSRNSTLCAGTVKKIIFVEAKVFFKKEKKEKKELVVVSWLCVRLKVISNFVSSPENVNIN